MYQPQIDISHGLPLRVRVADIVANPERYDGQIVSIEGCYFVDPYHGAYLHDEPPTRGGVITLLGGTNNTGRDFDWMTQKVCGTLVGTVRWKPAEKPLSLLCNDLCFDGDQTVCPRIEPR